MLFRSETVEQAAALAIKRGIPAFSPIAYTVPMAQKYQMPHSFPFWRQFDLAMLAPARTLVVLKIPGWQDSIGVREELAMADNFNIPVRFEEVQND